MGLRDQAIRCLRSKWKNTKLFAEEMYLILLQADDFTTGPIHVQLGDTSNVIAMQPLRLDPFVLPDFFLPDFHGNPQEITRFDIPTEIADERIRRVERILWARTAVPGKIVSGTGDTYKVDLYPNGQQAVGGGTESVRKGVTVKQLQIAEGAKIPANTWVCPVFWVIKARVTQEDLIRLPQETLLSSTTRVKILKEEFLMQVPVWLASNQ